MGFLAADHAQGQHPEGLLRHGFGGLLETRGRGLVERMLPAVGIHPALRLGQQAIEGALHEDDALSLGGFVEGGHPLAIGVEGNLPVARPVGFDAQLLSQDDERAFGRIPQDAPFGVPFLENGIVAEVRASPQPEQALAGGQSERCSRP
ncbi:hypothetical protein D3C87_1000220 [compost metagenome]